MLIEIGVGPDGMKSDAGKALRAREGRARIDDRHIEIEKLRHRRERLADMDRAGHQDAHGRRLHREEVVLARVFDGAAFADPELLLQGARERVLLELAGLHEPLLAVIEIGDEHRRRALAALGIEG